MNRLSRFIRVNLEYYRKLLKTAPGFYMMEGFLAAFALNLISNNNNFFATRLGAEDYQLSLLQLIPQLVNVAVLLPGGIFADSLKSKKKMVICSMAATAALYFTAIFTAYMGDARLTGFLAINALASGALTLYNISWQSFFPEVIPIERRNRTLTLRASWYMAPAIVSPLLTGFILSGQQELGAKIAAHQSFFLASSVLIVLQIRVLSRLKAEAPAPPRGVSLKNIRAAATSMARNKPFMLFCGVILVFYMSWHMDWTIYFIGETRYLGMNEVWISAATVGASLIQLATMKFWSRQNEKRGVTIPMIWGIGAMAAYPLAMILATFLPAPANIPIFVAMYALCSLCMSAVNLNVFQCLLKVLPDEGKTMCISIFNMLVSFSNAIMPVVGVAVYNAFGANLGAMRAACLTVFAMRLLALALWTARWHFTERRTKQKEAQA